MPCTRDARGRSAPPSRTAAAPSRLLDPCGGDTEHHAAGPPALPLMPSRSTGRDCRARPLRLLSLIALGALAPLVLAELVLRIADPFDAAGFIERESFSDALLVRHPDGSLALRAGSRASLYGHDAVIGAHGLRNRPVEQPKPDGLFRVLVLGDSVAFGWGVAEEQAFPRVLESLWNAAGPPEGASRVEVVNCGVPGWGMPNELLWLREVGIALDPDLVLVTLINNDLTDVITALETARGQVMRAPTRTPAWLGWSYLARSMAAAIEALRSGPVRNDYFVDLEGSRDYEAATEHVCTLLGDLHAAAGVPLVVMDTIGARTADGSVAYRVEGLVECLRRRGVPRFDAYLAIPGYAERYAVSPVDHHPNAEGHRQLAEWAYRWIRAHVYP